MLRLYRPLLFSATRCHYDVLGVARTASADDIKRAFRERAKQTHPDTGASTEESRQFRDLVEAYRVLRHEKRRREYDLNRANRGNFGQQPNTGYGAQDGRHSGRESAATPTARNPAEGVAIGIVFVGGVLVLVQAMGSPAPYRDNEKPRKPPTRMKSVATPSSQANSMNIVADSTGSSSTGDVSTVVSGGEFKVAGATGATGQEDGELIRAFYDPFFERWYKIPEGYEAPSGTDLTAWHNKRTDPVEWSRLFANGKLSEIIPRGGLQVRYLPPWEAYEPILILDPTTGKTIHADKRLPPRALKETCAVQF